MHRRLTRVAAAAEVRQPPNCGHADARTRLRRTDQDLTPCTGYRLWRNSCQNFLLFEESTNCWSVASTNQATLKIDLDTTWASSAAEVPSKVYGRCFNVELR